MKTIKIPSGIPSPRQLDELAGYIAEGKIAIIPTDTIYALVCDALNPKAIERLCRLKNINPDKSNLSIICPDIATAAEYAKIDNRAFGLIHSYTPGPFTFLLRAASTLPRAFKGRKTVGIRIPDCELDLSLAKALGHPLMTTSIQFDDDDYARDPGLIAEAYADKADVIAEGPDGDTEPSTIIDCRTSDFDIIRQGKGILD